MATWADVRRMRSAIPRPHREVSARLASPRQDGVLRVRVSLRKAERELLGESAPQSAILGARVADVGIKEALVADAPDTYFTTPHFDGYPAVLVRLAQISSGELAELIEDAWLSRAPKALVKQFLADPLEPTKSAGRC